MHNARSFVFGGLLVSLSACASDAGNGSKRSAGTGGALAGTGGMAPASAGGTAGTGAGGSPVGVGGVAEGGGAAGLANQAGGAFSGGGAGGVSAGAAGNAGTAGGRTGTGGGGASGTGGAEGSAGAPPSGDCEALVTDPALNWRDSTLRTDQEIVECLYTTLGRPVGYGEKATGGYDPAGNSHLVVIQKGLAQSVEEQIRTAVSSPQHNWIVFDKRDFAEESEIGMYRLFCGDPTVQSAIGGSESDCLNYRTWCVGRGYSAEADCLERFFNEALNDGDLPIRNPVIASNTTLDGRLTNAYFRFSGFAIGSDSSGQPVDTATSVVLTHLEFRGAGHTEDHGLDPDMIRSTGASHDIWIHKNTFDLTGDSAFDVKVGAYDITISFNRVLDVKRAALHGSSDSREINAQITTTMHHNAFVTRDTLYDTFGNTARRVPLIRRGTSHMWNNFFMNYRKDVLSVRVGASLLWEDNALLINATHGEETDERASELTRDVDGGNYRGDGVYLWFSDAACQLDDATRTQLTDASGSVGDLTAAYSAASQTAIVNVRMDAGQDLVDYVSATAGKHGQMPFNSPLAPSIPEVLAAATASCQ